MKFDNKQLSEVAFIAKTHGLNGHLSINFINDYSEKLFSKEIPVFFLIDGMPVPFFIEDYKNSGGYTATKFKYINSTLEAEKFIGCKVLLLQSDIPNSEDDDYEDELVGYKVFDSKHGYIGEITSFNFIPGNPVFETNYEGNNIIIPFTENIVTGINDDKQEIYIEAPEGLIELYIE